MANLVAVNIKRKDAEVASHGFSIFLDPKRIKLQAEAEITDMMEEEEPLSEADAGATLVVVEVQPTMLMPPSLSPPQQPTQSQEAAALVHDSTMSTEPESKSSEPASATEQAAPTPMAMDIEEDSWQSQPQPQPSHHPLFFSGFF